MASKQVRRYLFRSLTNIYCRVNLSFHTVGQVEAGAKPSPVGSMNQSQHVCNSGLEKSYHARRRLSQTSSASWRRISIYEGMVSSGAVHVNFSTTRWHKLTRKHIPSLLAASNAYHHGLSKKRECAQFLDDPAEYLPIDALGMAMILHGEDFPEDSAFGMFSGPLRGCDSGFHHCTCACQVRAC